MAAPALLVADDDPVARDLLAEVLTGAGYHVRAATDGTECLRLAEAEPFDLALIDLRMPDLDGLQVLQRLGARQPPVPVVILTAFATIETAIQTIRAGAWDYLSKPFRIDEIKLVVAHALEAQRLVRENLQHRRALDARYGIESLIGQSPEMVAIYKVIARLAALDTTVLLYGETGTGKELVARAIHQASPRAARPLVTVDCTALPEALFESELFGHERGAFTGAATSRRGLLESADGSTCLLDEVGELPRALQAKLLRVLQERVIRRVGGNEPIPVDVRIIAATHRDLRRMVDDGSFREDLYYRLTVAPIVVPPLRDRPGDIPLLAQHFLEKYARASGRSAIGFARETLAALTRHLWPGNVRELEHAIERAVALSSTALILPDDLPVDVRGPAELTMPGAPPARLTLEELKHWYVARILDEAGGNKARAAEMLGIDRRTLYRILARESEDGE
jgi:DNA-binding NtrC family response regulator